jgi:nucleotide-binding universal stress UspA family protein
MEGEMGYKTLFTVMTPGAPHDAAMAQAEALARSLDAHLDVLCMGVDRTQTGYYYAGANAIILQEALSRAHEDAEALAEQAKAMLPADIRWATETGVAQLGDIGRHVGIRARFSDFAILPMPYGKKRGAEAEAATEGVLFDAEVPVLVVPDGATPVIRPKKVMLGWDESAEALRAARAALPVLKSAELVNVTIVDPPVHGPNRSDPGGPLSALLSRHGVKVEIDVLSRTMPRISDVLLRQASDTGADLIVMGAYGHSRFHEAILGGATRDMLERTTVPLFMAH